MNPTQSTALAFAIAISLTSIIGAISACAPDTTQPTTRPDNNCSSNPANHVNPVQEDPLNK